MDRRRWLWIPLLLLCPALAFPAAVLADTEPIAAPGPTRPASEQDDEYYELFRTLVDVMHQVEQNYVEPIDRKELLQAAIRGVLQKLDPHSNYIPPEKINEFRTSIENEFGGVGLQVTIERGQLTVISPIYGAPAHRAGVLAGDRILDIEGTSTKGMSLDEATQLLKGRPGTRVSFTVFHPATGRTEKITVVREVVRIETVLGDTRKPNGEWDFMIDHQQKIGYIRMTAFGRETASDLRRAIQQLQKEGLRGLILDLRFNPGGLLSAAVDVSDMFISQGRIVSTRDRNGRERTWEATQPGTLGDFPLVVLINRYSASASEIVSACLQDHGRAVIMGERSFGKGSVQSVIELGGGESALKLTTASYHRPSGANIHRFENMTEADTWGVTPNEGFRIDLTDSELLQLVDFRRDRDILRTPGQEPPLEAPEPGQRTAPRVSPNFVDRQLQKALAHLSTALARQE